MGLVCYTDIDSEWDDGGWCVTLIDRADGVWCYSDRGLMVTYSIDGRWGMVYQSDIEH